MKNKFILTIASILSLVAIIGVGFAAWVIINPDVKAEEGGTISVETVTDKSYELKATITGKEIAFGAPETMDKAKAWLTTEEETATANLKAEIELTLTYKDASVIKDFTVAFEALKGGSATDDFWTAITNGYIDNPTISYTKHGASSATETISKDKTSFTLEKDSFNLVSDNTTNEKTSTLTLTVEFKWGTTKFGGNNPYEYYNANDYSKELAKTALDDITALHTALDTVSYKLTITAANA